jgi:2-methylisocitrate lyase-like PEP mutase family enzyme
MAALGVARVSVDPTGQRIALAALADAARVLLDGGGLAAMPSAQR